MVLGAGKVPTLKGRSGQAIQEALGGMTASRHRSSHRGQPGTALYPVG
jgi:hypothetical protein